MRKNKVLGLSLALGGAVATIAATFALYVVNPDNNRIHISVDTGQTEQVNYVVNIPSDQQNVASLKFDGSAPHNVSFSVGADVLEDKVYGQKAIQSKLEVSITGEVAQYLTLSDLSVSGYDASSYASGLKASATSGESRVYTLDVPLLIASDLTVSFSVNLPAENGKSTLDENVVVGLGNTDYAIEISLRDVEEDKQVFLTGSRIGDDAFRMAPDLESSSEGYIYENISLATTDEISAKKGSIVAAASSLSSGLYSPSVDGNHTIRWNATATDGLHGTPALNGETTAETPDTPEAPVVYITNYSLEDYELVNGSVDVTFIATSSTGSSLNHPVVTGPDGDNLEVVLENETTALYKFSATKVGQYTISATATIEGVTGSKSVTVNVVDDVNDTPDPVETTTLYARVPSTWGDTVNLYAWEDAPTQTPGGRNPNRAITELGMEWPGVAMEQVEGDLYKVEIANTLLSTIDNIIVNDMVDSGTVDENQKPIYTGNQTNDIVFDNSKNAVYVSDDGRAALTTWSEEGGIVVPTFPELPVDKVFYVKAPDSVTSVRIHYWGLESTNWESPVNAVKIENSNNVYSVSISEAAYNGLTGLIVRNGNDEFKSDDIMITSTLLDTTNCIYVRDAHNFALTSYSGSGEVAAPEDYTGGNITLYVKSVENFTNVYSWIDEYGETPKQEAHGGWPGTKMTLVDEDNSIYSFIVDRYYLFSCNFIFLKTEGGQTSDLGPTNRASLVAETANLLTLSKDDSNKYSYSLSVYTPTQEGGDLTPDQGGDETPSLTSKTLNIAMPNVGSYGSHTIEVTDHGNLAVSCAQYNSNQFWWGANSTNANKVEHRTDLAIIRAATQDSTLDFTATDSNKLSNDNYYHSLVSDFMLSNISSITLNLAGYNNAADNIYLVVSDDGINWSYVAVAVCGSEATVVNIEGTVTGSKYFAIVAESTKQDSRTKLNTLSIAYAE